MLNISIAHFIYLTRDERYALHEKESIEVVGHCLPVWYEGKKTTEPAKEVFCKYYLFNQGIKPIKVLKNGFEIYVPTKKGTDKSKMSNKLWRTMTPEQQIIWYDKMIPNISSKSLLDIEDGGSTCLHYRENNKVKQNGKLILVNHLVDIKDISALEETLV